jgi:hypothetical protein
MNLINLTPAQLRQAANLKEQIEGLHKQLAAIAGPGMPSPLKAVNPVSRKKGGMSAAGKARLVAALKARWAKIKATKVKPAATPKAVVPVTKPLKKKFTMSAAARAKISATAKARWAKIKAAKK